MDPLALIAQAADQYRQLDLLGAEIEAAIQCNDLAALPALCGHLDALQEQARGFDHQLFAQLRGHQELLDLDDTKEWLQRMQAIQERNQRLVPHLRSIMAIQRNEVHTLRQGNSMLQGYKPGIAQTERRFSSSG